jgi:hypothetical protein
LLEVKEIPGYAKAYSYVVLLPGKGSRPGSDVIFQDDIFIWVVVVRVYRLLVEDDYQVVRVYRLQVEDD